MVLARRVGTVWLRNAVAALAVLLVVKYGLVLYVGFDRAWEPALELLPKSLLFFGWDVIGAAAMAVVVALLCLPLVVGRRGDPNRRAVAAVSAGLQAVHALWCGAGFFLAVTTGGFLDKTALELAQLGGSGASGGISASLTHYLTVPTLSFLLGLAALGTGGVLLAPRALRRLRGNIRDGLAAAVVLAALTTVIVPPLTSGADEPFRVRTHGLDGSPGVEVVRSYIRAALPKPAQRGLHAGEWQLDLSPPRSAGQTEPPGPPPPGPPPLAPARPQRTNLIVVFLESVGERYLREADPPLPFLTETGREADGAYLRAHVSTWPQTTKAYVGLLCSELPFPSHLPVTVVNPDIPCRSLPEVLRDEGWRTALVTSADLSYERMIRFLGARFDVVLDWSSLPGREEAWHNSWGVDEGLAVRQVLAQADAARDAPFFVLYGMSVAHHPYDTCAEDEATPLPDPRAAYGRALRFVDARLRELWDGLVARGLTDRTLLVVVSDHGEGFGQHSGSQGHGPAVYDENIHVPFVLRGPQLAGLRLEVNTTTSHLDVAPTVLGLLGVAPPCTMKGRDLVHDGSPRVALFGGRPPRAQRGLIDGRWKYVREVGGPDMVFDLLADPGETRDVSAEHRAELVGWSRRVDEWEAHSARLIPNYAAIARSHGCLAP